MDIRQSPYYYRLGAVNCLPGILGYFLDLCPNIERKIWSHLKSCEKMSQIVFIVQIIRLGNLNMM